MFLLEPKNNKIIIPFTILTNNHFNFKTFEEAALL